MRRRTETLQLVCGLLCASTLSAQPARTHTIEIRNANWFAESAFVRRTMYVVGDRFSDRRPARINSVIDLTGRFVIPPYGDAHTHAFGALDRVDSAARSHSAAGVFYAMNLLNSNSDRRAIAARLRTRPVVDVVLSSAGVTGVRGHPILSAEMAANGWSWDSLGDYWPALLTSHNADGDTYVVIDSAKDVRRRWSRVIANRPDIVKIFLLDTDRFAELRADSTSLDANGLDPRMVPTIVRAAHARGLRVAAHIETAADFRVAVRAGVDVIAHLPGLAIQTSADSSLASLTQADAQLAAAHGVAVVPTAWLATQWRVSRGDSAQIRRTKELERLNLRMLSDAGVVLAVGSDGFASTLTEAEYLLSLGVFSAADVLRMWTYSTPRLIFPRRHIGLLRDGQEASLLALTCNPLRDFSCATKISYRMKRGRAVPSDAP
jgi:imidazolonepropionase-like amidohydrolase